jgi:glycosyltransferase involved in cell wall biosynthesis
MAAHNDRRFLPEAVESLLGQGFGDLEFLIVDDGSTDGSADYLRGLRDARVRIISNPTNLGLTRSLNIGLDHATGSYVARMDADDVAEPERLRRQVEFLDANPDVGLLGTGRTLIDEHGHKVADAPATSGRLRVLWKMLLGNAFAHPSVMLRRDVLERHGLRYDERYKTAQDYELWVRVLRCSRGDNLPDQLLRYRLRDNGISRSKKGDQLANHDRIAHAAVRTILPDFDLAAAHVPQLRGRFGGFSVRDPAMDPADERWRAVYLSMLQAFRRRYGSDPVLDQAAVERVAARISA